MLFFLLKTLLFLGNKYNKTFFECIFNNDFWPTDRNRLVAV